MGQTSCVWRRTFVLSIAGLMLSGSAAETWSGSVPAVLPRLARRLGTVRVIAELELPVAVQSPLNASALDGERRDAIASAQAALSAELREKSWRMTRQFRTIPFVALEVAPDALAALERSGMVRAVEEDRLESPSLQQSAPLVGASQAWAAGFDGTGWTVAVLDTGVDGGHDFLQGKVVSEACYSANSSCPNGESEQIGAGSGAPCTYAQAACLHGTHVGGIVAGRGDDISGIARGANLISIQVFSRLTGPGNCQDAGEDPCAQTYTSDQLAALERVYELRSSFNIAAVNMSLGGGRFSSQAVCDAQNAARKAVMDNLRAAGIATIVASGNEAFTDALDAPACISSVVSVGATDKSDHIPPFSNSAPFLSLLAPGVSITSSLPGGAFGVETGTSQATPHVAGAWAILKQRSPGASVDQVLSALQTTGLPITDPRNGLTFSRIRIVEASRALSGTLPGVQVTPDQKRNLVSKDVGGERWAITQNLDDQTVTGNVFSSSGGDPKFVWCERISDNGDPDLGTVQITYSCQGADKCTSSPCSGDQWSFISEVTLSGSFFLPPPAAGSAAGAAASTVPARDPASGAVASSAAGRTQGSAGSPPGVQVTPDQKRNLVSKNVGEERWAITQNLDDQTVTGNVFFPSGGDPKFVWCERISDNGDPDPYTVRITFSCQGADRCTSSPCSTNQWSFISEVTLPGSFFLAPQS